MVRPKKTDTPVREKVLRAASRLFFEQGYHTTGTNQIIAEAGVSKASFYDHFPSKENLGVVYVRDSAARSVKMIEDGLAAAGDPLGRYLMFFQSVRDFLVATDFRGCNFGNIAREFPDGASPIRREVVDFENRYRSLLRGAVDDLFDSDPDRFDRLPLSREVVADRYYLLLEGAIAACANFKETWPLDVAEKAVCDLVGAREVGSATG